MNDGLPIPSAASWFSPRKLKVHRVAPGSWLLAPSQENEKIPSETTGKLTHHQQSERQALEGQMSLGSSDLS